MFAANQQLILSTEDSASDIVDDSISANSYRAEPQTSGLSQFELMAKARQLIDESLQVSSQKQYYLSCFLRFQKFQKGQLSATTCSKALSEYLTYLVVERHHTRAEQTSTIQVLTFILSKLFRVNVVARDYVRAKVYRGHLERFGNDHCYQVVRHMQGTSALMAKLVLGTQLKLRQLLDLRVADVDIKRNLIHVKNRNGHQLRIVKIPLALILDIKIQTIKVHRLVQQEKELLSDHLRKKMELEGNQLEPDSQYLFPYGRSSAAKSKSQFLNQTPLKVLKNDIRVALRSYQRFSPHSADKPQRSHKSAGLNQHLAYPMVRQSPQQAFVFEPAFSDKRGAA